LLVQPRVGRPASNNRCCSTSKDEAVHWPDASSPKP
jgi:hypothetical protein